MLCDALKFAAVREDPLVEAQLVQTRRVRKCLVVASGGCTALSLARQFPHLDVTAFDNNPQQIAHVTRKLDAVRSGNRSLLNVESDNPLGLNQCGAFDALFRSFRHAVWEFVTSRSDVEAFFAGEPGAAPTAWFASRYWPALCETFFCDALLVAMFGTAAVQHAVPGSYPGYFRALLERGLQAPHAHRNPYLQHIFLGRYRGDADLPAYLCAGAATLNVRLVTGTLGDVRDLVTFDLVSLSNLFDWVDEDAIRQTASLLAAALKPGACIVWRQLNNRRDLRSYFAGFTFTDPLEERLAATERSLFYNTVRIGVAGASRC